MQTVSQKWNENQAKRVITAPSTLDVTVIVTDPAQRDASVTVSSEEAYSHGAQLADGLEKLEDRFLTLEDNLWLLDGTFIPVPNEEAYPDNGFISSVIADENCAFSAPPTVTISFPDVYDTYLEGVTIVWGAAYDYERADTFTVTAYNGSIVKQSKTVTGNEDTTSVVFMDVSGYDSIQITVEKWALPYHRARIQSVVLGVRHTYTKSDITEFTHKAESDLLSSELPNLEVSFEVKNLDFLYDPDNESGLSKYLMTRQQVTVEAGYELDGAVEKIPVAVAFLEEWESPRDGIRARFTARGLTEFMEEKYAGASSGTLQAIAEAALTQANLPTLSSGAPRWLLDDSLASINAPSDADLSDYSIAEVLQLCANAACCIMRQDRNGVLHIEPYTVPASTSYAIPNGIAYGYPETSLSKPLKSVNINDGAYVLSVASQGVEQTVDNPLISTARAPTVAAWVRGVLLNRQTLSGEWRADPKVDVLDAASIATPFKTNRAVLTSVELSFNGAWRGDYEARVFP